MGAPLHLIHVFPDFGPGGAQIRTIALINALGPSFRHTILPMIGDGQATITRIDTSLDVVVETPDRGRWGPFYPFYLGRKLRRLRPDVLFAYNWGAFDAVMGAGLTGLRPYVQVMDGIQNEEEDVEIGRRRFFRRLFYRRAGAVVVVSRQLERLALESWGVAREKVMHVPNGIDTDRFTPGSDSGIREQLGLAPDTILAGSIAHVRVEKDHAAMVAAFAGIEKRHPGAHLLFAGRVPSEKTINPTDVQAWERVQEVIAKHGLEERVHFVGERSDTLPCYRALDVFMLASRVEQMPLSVAEAMACCKPVLSTHVGDIRWMVGEPNREFVVEAGDAEAYRAALDRLLGDAELRRRLGAANRERALETFRLSRMVDTYRSLCLRLAKR